MEISTGDWYALTADGQLQVSNQNKPGPKAFKLHTLAGFVTYKSAHKQTGIDSRAQNLSNVEGYANVADMSYPITKYLIADNGKYININFRNKMIRGYLVALRRKIIMTKIPILVRIYNLKK